MYPNQPMAPAPAPYPYPAPTQPNPYAAPAQYAPPAAPVYQPTIPTPTQVAAPPAPIQLPTGGIGAPAATSDPNIVRPKVGDLNGRLLLMRPTRLELDVASTVYRNPDGSPTRSDRLTVDVIVLDGPPFPYGGDLDKGKPHTHHAQVIPFEIPGLFINQSVLVDQMRGCLSPGGVPMIAGRLGKVPSTKGSPAWKLTDATPDELAMANHYVASRQTMSAPQPAAPQAPVYSAPPAPQAGPYAPMPAPVPSAPPAAYGPQAPAQPAYAPIPSSGPAAGYPAPVPQGYQCPPGMDPATWATYTPDQQLSVWHQIQAQPQG